MRRRNTSKQRQVQYEKGRKNDIIEISCMNLGREIRFYVDQSSLGYSGKLFSNME